LKLEIEKCGSGCQNDSQCSTKNKGATNMNGTKKRNNQQHISITCPEENLAALIGEAKTNFEGIFSTLIITG